MKEDYYKKYLKYKKKYNNIKNRNFKGGEILINGCPNQGFSNIFGTCWNNVIFMAIFLGDKTKNKSQEIIKKLKDPNNYLTIEILIKNSEKKLVKLFPPNFSNNNNNLIEEKFNILMNIIEYLINRIIIYSETSQEYYINNDENCEFYLVREYFKLFNYDKISDGGSFIDEYLLLNILSIIFLDNFISLKIYNKENFNNILDNEIDNNIGILIGTTGHVSLLYKCNNTLKYCNNEFSRICNEWPKIIKEYKKLNDDNICIKVPFDECIDFELCNNIEHNYMKLLNISIINYETNLNNFIKNNNKMLFDFYITITTQNINFSIKQIFIDNLINLLKNGYVEYDELSVQLLSNNIDLLEYLLESNNIKINIYLHDFTIFTKKNPLLLNYSNLYNDELKERYNIWYEWSIAKINKGINNDEIETLYILSNKNYNFIESKNDKWIFKEKDKNEYKTLKIDNLNLI